MALAVVVVVDGLAVVVVVATDEDLVVVAAEEDLVVVADEVLAEGVVDDFAEVVREVVDVFAAALVVVEVAPHLLCLRVAPNETVTVLGG